MTADFNAAMRSLAMLNWEIERMRLGSEDSRSAGGIVFQGSDGGMLRVRENKATSFHRIHRH